MVKETVSSIIKKLNSLYIKLEEDTKSTSKDGYEDLV